MISGAKWIGTCIMKFLWEGQRQLLGAEFASVSCTLVKTVLKPQIHYPNLLVNKTGGTADNLQAKSVTCLMTKNEPMHILARQVHPCLF